MAFHDKKRIKYVLLLGIIFVLGITIAYFRSSLSINGLIGSKVFKATYTSVLDTPESWLPGDTTTGDFTVRNDSNVDVAVRAKIDESWVDSNGDTLPNKYDNQDVISLNFGGGWTSHTDGYYYYYQSLKPGDETNSLIDLVTFNDIFGRKAICTDSDTDSDVATCVKGGAYGAGTYSLKVTFEVVQSDAYESEWHISAEDRMYPVTVSLDANGGTVSESNRTVYLGETYGSLPTPTRDGYTFLGWNGKNLFNIEDATKSYVTISNEKMYFDTSGISGNVGSYFGVVNYMNFTPISRRYESQELGRHEVTFIGDSSFNKLQIRLNTNKRDSYINVDQLWENGRPYTLSYNLESIDLQNARGVVSEIQLEEGDKATAYEPYYIKSDTEVVQSGSHVLHANWVKSWELTNLIQNGSFENTGWSNCNYDSNTKYVGSYSCRMEGTTSDAEVLTWTNDVPLINNHKYYVSVYSKSSLSTYVQIYWPYFYASGEVVLSNTTSSTWTKHSALFTKSLSTNSYGFRIDFNNKNNEGYINFDALLLVDLTESFGSGNEPSQEWCDENIDYFDGTTVIFK